MKRNKAVYLKPRKKFFGIFLLSMCPVLFGCSNPSSNASSEVLSEETPNYYMNFINSLSSTSFDYENPNYGLVFLDPTSNQSDKFNGEQIYSVISALNTIPLYSVKLDESWQEKMSSGIKIQVSYHYVEVTKIEDDAIVCFTFLTDGSFVFEDHRKIFSFRSNTNAVDFNALKSKITAMKDTAK